MKNGSGEWCTLSLANTIQVDHSLWVDSLNIVAPSWGVAALSMKQMDSKLWLTNVTITGSGSSSSVGIDSNGLLFAESVQLPSLLP